MLSEKLLSEVLGRGIKECHMTRNNPKTYIEFTTDIDTKNAINIHELAHKCKEWAYGKGYLLQSQINECNIFKVDRDGFIGKRLECIDSETEVDAVLEACEWILKEAN